MDTLKTTAETRIRYLKWLIERLTLHGDDISIEAALVLRQLVESTAQSPMSVL